MKPLCKMCAALLACLLAAGMPAMLPVPAGQTVCAADETEDEDFTEIKEGALTFQKSAYAAEVVGCDPEAMSVVIPDKIDGVPVVSIGEEAFLSCGLSAVTLPDSVEVIGSRAFGDCTALKAVDIPASVMHIEQAAFLGCTSLAEVTLHEGLTSIEGEAFKETALQTIEIPSTVSAFGYRIFDGTPYWETLTAEKPLVVYNSILVDGRAAVGKVVIPDGVTSIVGYAFEKAEMTSVSIPESVKTIGMDAFTNCKALTSVKLPEGLIEMEIGILSGCSSLKTVTIPDSVTVIRSGVFANCSSLEEVIFPEHQIDIYSKSFENTPWLAAKQAADPLVIVNGTVIDGQACKGAVVIPDEVTIIASRAFDHNEAITSVTVPAGVREIWDETFLGCTGLEAVTLKGTDYISNRAFSGCTSLHSMTVAGCLSEVDQDAFKDIPGQISVVFYGSKAQWSEIMVSEGNDAFLHASRKYIVSGDADGDGKLTVSDVVAFQKWLLCLPKARVRNPHGADLDLNGVTDVYDLALMKRALLDV